MADGAWSEPEIRGRVQLTTVSAIANTSEVLVVVLRAHGYCSFDEILAEYARDLALRVAEGWALASMTMYPVGHSAGAGYPGMDLDKAMVVATYDRFREPPVGT